MKVKYIPVENSHALYGTKQSILKRYEGLNIYTLNRWLSEMRDNKQFRFGVINPTAVYLRRQVGISLQLQGRDLVHFPLAF